MDNDFATGYALGADSGGSNCNGGWGGNGFGDWLVVLLLFVLMGGGFWGGNGWGGSGGSGLQGMATRADINEGFALDNITSGIRSIQQGICDSTYALNNGINNGFSSTQMSMMQGFNAANTATMQGFNAIQQQLAGCCCENREAIAQVRYDMASQACDTRNLIQSTTRDLIDNQKREFPHADGLSGTGGDASQGCADRGAAASRQSGPAERLHHCGDEPADADPDRPHQPLPGAVLRGTRAVSLQRPVRRLLRVTSPGTGDTVGEAGECPSPLERSMT